MAEQHSTPHDHAPERDAWVHEAVIQVKDDVDLQAVGAAVTIALCGHWMHEGSCLWPHNNEMVDGLFRTLFVCEPGEEPAVRARLSAALGGGPQWRVVSERARPVADAERPLAQDLLRVPRGSTSIDGTDVMTWLLDSDSAIRWQVLQDLAGASAETVAAERARVISEGWGARLLALRGSDGQWAGGALFPAERAPGAPRWQPWTATAYSLMALADFGADPASPVMRDTIELMRANCRWEHDGQPFFAGEVEPCINGMVVVLGTYFGQPVDAIVERLVGEQLRDGGWNCWTEYGSVRSSFHTTIRVLEGLVAHERATGGTPASVAARRRGEEYLLERHLLRRKSTGDVVKPEWLRFSYPTRWHYDVLRGLEYFRTVGGTPDARLDEAVSLLRSKQQPDGTWLLEHTHPGAMHFAMEGPDGTPSRWNTLRAMRVLRWFDGYQDVAAGST